MNMIAMLFHKNIPTATMEISEDSGAILRIKCHSPEHMPFLREMSLKEINFWWKHRAVPDSRKDIRKYLKEEGVDNTLKLLSKNLALSLSDCYWVCPGSLNLNWERVNLYHNSENITFSDSDGNVFSNNPNGSLNGNMEKEAFHEGSNWNLRKYSETSGGEQCINEKFSNWIHERQGFLQYVKYELEFQSDRCVSCVCPFFTGEKVEFITAYCLAESKKQRQDVSNFEQYIELCTSLGLQETEVRNFMDYMVLFDFIITNTDRHYQNFGILRNPDNLKAISLAPVFDCGNSMFYKNDYRMTAPEILNLEIASMAKREEKMLEFITNRSILNIELLPSKEETKRFYMENGIGEPKAEIISENYQTKIDMLSRFQAGQKISRYTVRDW